MTESRILWLALGVFVGYVIWGESRKRGMAQMINVPDTNTDSAVVSDQTGFAPTSSCSGGC